MREVDLDLGHADFFARSVGCRGEGEKAVVCEAYVLGGDNDKAAGDVERIFARGEHAGEIVEGGGGRGATD